MKTRNFKRLLSLLVSLSMLLSLVNVTALAAEEDTCGHEWGEWELTLAPAEDKEGTETRTCDLCGAAETRAVEALGEESGEPSSEPAPVPVQEPAQETVQLPAQTFAPVMTASAMPADVDGGIDPQADEPDWENHSDSALWLKNNNQYYGAAAADVKQMLFDAGEYNDAVVVCNSNAVFEGWTHMHVYNNLTVYGNNAKVVSGEHDFEIDTYKYSTENGKQDEANGQFMNGSSITLEVYELDGIAAWGQRNTNAEINLKFVDCQNMHRIYFSGTKGKMNIDVQNCSFAVDNGSHPNTSIYSNAPGRISISDTHFIGVAVPINLNNKSAGEQNITVSKCTFDKCATTENASAVTALAYAAPIRVLCTNEAGSSKLTVDTCSFTNSGEANGDILLGDGRTGEKESYLFQADIINTTANVQIQKPGDSTNESGSKLASTLVTAGSEPQTITNAAAQVGSKYYATLQGAVDAAEDNDEVIMLADYTEGQSIRIYNKILSLDLNGHVLAPNKKNTGTQFVYGLDVGGTADLTVVDHGETKGKIAPDTTTAYSAGIVVWDTAKVTVDSVCVEATKSPYVSAGIMTNGAKTLAGSSITVKGDSVIRGSYEGIFQPGYATLTLEGGEISGYTGVEVRGGTLRIPADSTAVITGDYTVAGIHYGFSAAPDGNGNTTYGVGVAVSQHSTNADINVDIAGGTLRGYYPLFEQDLQDTDAQEKISILITGGSLEHLPYTEYTADPYRGGTKAGYNISDEGYTVPAAVKRVDEKAQCTISGGTFSSDVSAYVADGYAQPGSIGAVVLDTSADGKAARIDGQYFKTLESAFKAAKDNETVTLLKECTVENPVTVDRKMTLDLNGQKLNMEFNSNFVIAENGDLTVQAANGGTVASKSSPNGQSGTFVVEGGSLLITGGVYTSPYCRFVACRAGTAKITGGNFTITEMNQGLLASSILFATSEKSTLIVEGGTFTSLDTKENDKSVKCGQYGVYVNNGAKLILGNRETGNGPEINTYFAAAGMDNTAAPATIEIYGGKYTSHCDLGEGYDKFNAALYLSAWADVTITGGEFAAEGNNTHAIAVPYQNAALKLNISGGTFKSSAGNDAVWRGTQNGAGLGAGKPGFGTPEIKISGGKFSADVNNDYIVEGSQDKQDQDADGYWIIVPAEGSVAAIGSTGYTTLQDAVTSARSGDIVTLLKDTSGSGVIVNKSITIDFGGNTYTVDQTPLAGSAGTETQAFQLLAGSDKEKPNTVIMKNGTVVLPSTNNNLKMGIQNYTNLTLDNMKLDAGGNSNISYVLSNNNGITTITGGTVLTAADGNAAFDVYDYSSNGYGNVTVKVDNAAITGRIEVSSSEKARLEISGGTFSQEIVSAWCAAGYRPIVNADGTYSVSSTALSIASNPSGLTGAGTVILTVTPANLSGGVNVSCDYGITVIRNANGTYSASLPNIGRTYTFTVTGGGMSATCTVSVTRYTGGGTSGGSSSGGGSGSGGSGRPAVNPSRPTVDITDPSVPLSELPNVFTDVPETAYYRDPVVWAVQQGITGGTSATTFSPGSACTRAQIVTFLYRAAGSPSVEGENPFTDVAEGAYYYDAVLWAVANGITGGTTATTFSPNNACTRGQTVTFLHRYAKTPAAGGENPFTDVAEGAYCYNAVLWAVANGITSGTSATTFGPDAVCTRGQIVTFLYRALAEKDA